MNPNGEETATPTTSTGSSNAGEDVDIEVVLELLGELRQGYINLETVVVTEPERLLAQTARESVDRDIERMCELRLLAAAHRAHMADFARRIQRSQVHVQLIQLMLRQARQSFEMTAMPEMPPASTSTPDAGGDDGGAARQMRRLQLSYARLDNRGQDVDQQNQDQDRN
ncbi:hypothetical protein KR074_008598 [Drosophila pseudoananassae]|nr:hypothetical protein KR074_008598 [Drosophila pseudoananassae]